MIVIQIQIQTCKKNIRIINLLLFLQQNLLKYYLQLFFLRLQVTKDG